MNKFIKKIFIISISFTSIMVYSSDVTEKKGRDVINDRVVYIDGKKWIICEDDQSCKEVSMDEYIENDRKELYKSYLENEKKKNQSVN